MTAADLVSLEWVVFNAVKRAVPDPWALVNKPWQGPSWSAVAAVPARIRSVVTPTPSGDFSP